MMNQLCQTSCPFSKNKLSDDTKTLLINILQQLHKQNMMDLLVCILGTYVFVILFTCYSVLLFDFEVINHH